MAQRVAVAGVGHRISDPRLDQPQLLQQLKLFVHLIDVRTSLLQWSFVMFVIQVDKSEHKRAVDALL